MTVYPLVSVNDIPLDDPLGRWGVRRDLSARSLPGIRATQVTIPGRMGVRWRTDDPYDVTTFQVGLWVFGSGSTENARTADIEANLESLFFLLSQTPLGIVYQWSEDEYRECVARVVSSSTPVFNDARDAAQFDIIFEIPDVFWREPFTYTFSDTINVGSGIEFAQFEVPFLQGSTAPIDDLEIIISGSYLDLVIAAGDVSNGLNYESNAVLSTISSIDQTKAMYIDCKAGRAWLQNKRYPTWNEITRTTEKTADFWSVGLDSESYWLRAHPISTTGEVTQFDRSVFLAIRASTSEEEIRVAVRGRRAFL